MLTIHFQFGPIRPGGDVRRGPPKFMDRDNDKRRRHQTHHITTVINLVFILLLECAIATTAVHRDVLCAVCTKYSCLSYGNDIDLYHHALNI